MYIRSVQISTTLLDGLSLLAKSRIPEESCAALFGINLNPTVPIAKVERFVELKNVVHSEIEFRWDEMEFYQQYVVQKNRGLDFVGVFHSHPHDPAASGYDRTVIKQTGKLYPELVWLIYGSTTHSFIAYVLSADLTIQEIPITPTDESTQLPL